MAANVHIQQILIKRGNTASISSYTGPIGEPVYNTQTHALHIQDGATPGGHLVTGDTLPIQANLAVLQMEVANIAGITGNVTQLEAFFANVNLEAINNSISSLEFIASNGYGNSNVAAYLPTNSTITGIQSSLVAVNANVVAANSAIVTANVALKAYVDNKIALLANAPAILDTLGQIAANLQADESSITQILGGQAAANIQIANLWSNAVIQDSKITAANLAISNITIANLVNGSYNVGLAADGHLQLPGDKFITGTPGPYAVGMRQTGGCVFVTSTSTDATAYTQLFLGYSSGLTVTAKGYGGSVQNYIFDTHGNVILPNNMSFLSSPAISTTGIVFGDGTFQTSAYTGPQDLSSYALATDVIAANAHIQTLDANVGGFYTWANTHFGTSSYSNSNVAAYLVANPQAGTYSNTNVTAYLAGNISTGNVAIGTSMYAHGLDNSFGTTNGSKISFNSRLDVTGSAAGYGMIINNLVQASGGLTVIGNSNATSFYGTNYYWANGVSLLNGISGSYSNANVASYLIANPQAGTFSNTNVSAYVAATTFSSVSTSLIQNVGQINGTAVYVQTNGANNFYFDNTGNLTLPGVQNPSIGGGYLLNVKGIVGLTATSAATISGFSNVSAATFTFSNGVNIFSTIAPSSSYSNANVASYLVANPQAGTYSNTNVAAYIPADPTITAFQANVGGFYTWANTNFGTANYSNVNVAAYLSANPQGGTTYTNANVVSMLAANSYIALGNVVTTYPTQSNITTLFVGNNTTIATGSAAAPSATHILNNAYFGANGAMYARNTYANGIGQFYIDGGNFYWNAQGTSTANAVAGLGGRMTLTSAGLSTVNGMNITSAGTLTGVGVTSTNGLTLNTVATIATNQATASIFPATATTISVGTVATTVTLASTTPGGTGSNVFVGNAVGTQTGNLTVRARGQYNYTVQYGVAGGYNSPPYTNQALTGGSGTGMTATYSSTGGYVNFPITITNPGTGYKNGDVLTLPGGLGATTLLSNYNPNFVNSPMGQSDFLFTMDGNILLPTNGNISYANSVSILSTLTGNITISNINATHYGNAVGTTATYSGNIITTGNVVSNNFLFANGVNILGTPTSVANGASSLTFATSGGNGVFQIGGVQTATFSQTSISMIGGISATANITAANIIATQYGNSIGTTATYSGNVTAGNINANQYGNSIGTTATYSGNVTAGNTIVTNVFGTTPNVTIQAGIYSTVFDNTGNITVGGTGFTMPTRPAFRIYGGTPSWFNTANTNLKGSSIVVDYNQGSYFNSTNGVFTAPVAGLYQVTFNARVGSNNSQNQVVVGKNGLSTAGNVAVMWESDTNTGTAIHYGVTTVIKLVAGDWLSANIAVGNIQFDQNDSWTVTYIG